MSRGAEVCERIAIEPRAYLEAILPLVPPARAYDRRPRRMRSEALFRRGTKDLELAGNLHVRLGLGVQVHARSREQDLRPEHIQGSANQRQRILWPFIHPGEGARLFSDRRRRELEYERNMDGGRADVPYRAPAPLQR